jgi:hypothetical protein
MQGTGNRDQGSVCSVQCEGALRGVKYEWTVCQTFALTLTLALFPSPSVP